MSVGGGPGASGFGCEWVFVEVSWGYVSWVGGGCGMDWGL